MPQNLNISSYYDLINAEYGKKGIFESGTIRLRYYYSAKYKPDRLVDGIINDGHYCEEVRFKVTDPAYTEVRVDDKKLTPDSNGYYTVSYADKEQTIKLIDNNGCNVQLYIKVLEIIYLTITIVLKILFVLSVARYFLHRQVISTVIAGQR